MKSQNSLSILFILLLIFLATGIATASFTSEAAEIPYQINNSDRIVVGTVSEIDMYYDYMIVTIEVNEWLYNPLPAKLIRVRSGIGTNVASSTEPGFIQNESVLLMLKDENPGEQLFSVSIGEPGKHPVSDRELVIEELKAQGKWQKENQTMDNTDYTGVTESTGTAVGQEENQTYYEENNTGEAEKTKAAENQEKDFSSALKSNSIPFTGLIWVFAMLLGAAMYVRK